jgi:chloramphenicol O-acetyltransferase type A
MRHQLDMASWARRDHFAFFNKFEEPFFGVCVEVDCTRAHAFVKESGISFFLYYLWCALKAANEIESFRYRIDGEAVWIYDEVHASPTINRPDGSFGFAYMDFHDDLIVFLQTAAAERDRVQNSTGLFPATSGENVLHMSSVPWLRFTGISHARSFSFPDSCPKIAFGKMTEVNGRLLMPLSVHVHHALMDGYQVSQFISSFETALQAR